MMAKPYEISLVSNTRQLNSDLKRSADAVDGISDALDDMAREGEDAGEKLEDSFKDAARAAKRAGDDVGDGFSGGIRRMADQSREVGDEIRQNLGEGIANAARGDFASLGDTIGDTLGGVTAGIGGIGTAALGVAGAAGIGAIVAAIDTANQKAEDARKAAGDWADAYIESGQRVLTFEQESARVKGFYTDPDKIKEAEDAQKAWGVSFDVAALALSGNATAIGYVSEKVDELKARLAETPQSDLMGNISTEWIQAQQALDGANEKFAIVQEGMERGARLADGWSGYLRDVAKNTEGATTAIDEFGDAVVSLPDGTTIYIDAETGQATTDTDALEQKIYSLPDKTVKVNVDTSAFYAAQEELRRLELDKRVEFDYVVNERRGRSVLE